MDDWVKFKETTLPEKEELYSNLNMEDITHYTCRLYEWKKSLSRLWNKRFGEYHDLYLKIDTLLLAVFENFRKMFLKINYLDPVKFLSAPGLTWQAVLKKTEVKLGLLTDINMLLMVEKGIRGGICHSNQNAKANIEFINITIKIKNHHILNIRMQVIYIVGQCHKGLL